MGYWAEFCVLYSRTLLVIHLKYISVYISVPTSLTIPSHPPTPLVTVSLSSVSVSLFVFKQVHLYHLFQIPHKVISYGICLWQEFFKCSIIQTIQTPVSNTFPMPETKDPHISSSYSVTDTEKVVIRQCLMLKDCPSGLYWIVLL